MTQQLLSHVRQEQVDNLLDQATTQEHVFYGKVLVVVYQLPNGFTLVGKGACVDPNRFNLEIERVVARADVEHQLWQLEGYRLQQQIADAVAHF